VPCLSTGRRGWNGCLRTMVIIIHKLPVSSFTFLQCVSGTEFVNLSGTPYRRFSGATQSVWLSTGYPKATISQFYNHPWETHSPVPWKGARLFVSHKLAPVPSFRPGYIRSRNSHGHATKRPYWFQILTDLITFPFHDLRGLDGTLKIPRSRIEDN
jgi:hypothetical protein